MLLKEIGKKFSNINYLSKNAAKYTYFEEEQNNILIGQLAYLKGFISEEDVHQILDIQKSVPKPFGELCVEKGIITSNQMSDLLQLQLKNQCFLFNSLMPASQNRGEMNTKLDQFVDEELRKDQSAAGSKLFDTRFLNLIFKQTRTFLFHQGYFTNLESISSEFETADNHLNFSCELTSEDLESSYYLCLGLNKRIVTSIANARQEYYTNKIDSGEFQDIFIEIMFCLNYKITQVLRKLGHNIKHGASLAYVPHHRKCVSLKFNTIIDPIIIAVVK